MAALSVGVSPGDGETEVVVTTILCILIGISSNALYSVLFSVGGMMRGYQKCRKWICGVVAELFSLAGFGSIRSAFTR